MAKTGSKLIDKDRLNAAIRIIEQLMSSQGRHMSTAQIYDLITKTALKHMHTENDNYKLMKELNTIKN